MTDYKRKNWIINIENSAAAVESRLGSAVVRTQFVFIDFSQPVIQSLLEYCVIIVLFMVVGYYAVKVLKVLHPRTDK